MSHRGDLTERLVRIPLLLAERPRSQYEVKPLNITPSVPVALLLAQQSFVTRLPI